MLLRSGEIRPIKVLVLRRDNFEGEIDLTVEGLPPGVHATPAKVESGQSSASLFLSATDGMTDWAGPIRLVGRAKLAGTDSVRVARSASVVWDVNDSGTEPIESHLVESLFLSTTAKESIPATLLVKETAAFEMTAGAKLQIPFQLLARSELVGTIKVRAAGSSALETAKEFEINAKTNQASLELDLSQQKLTPGVHAVYLIARAQAKYRRLPVDQVQVAEAELKKDELALQQAEKTAADLKAAANKTTAARTAAPDDADKVRLEKLATEAAAQAQEADKEKQRLADLAKAAGQKLTFEERTVTLYSNPFTVKVSPAPATTAALTR
jgi:hypothetical protein